MSDTMAVVSDNCHYIRVKTVSLNWFHIAIEYVLITWDC